MLREVVIFVGGAVFWLLVQNLLLPDSCAVWLARRRNCPFILLPVGVLLLAVSAPGFLYALGCVFLEVVARLRVHPGVWALSGTGVVLIVVSVVALIHRRRVVTSIAVSSTS